MDRIVEYHDEHLYIYHLDLKIINTFSLQFIYFVFSAEYLNILSGIRDTLPDIHFSRF